MNLVGRFKNLPPKTGRVVNSGSDPKKRISSVQGSRRQQLIDSLRNANHSNTMGRIPTLLSPARGSGSSSSSSRSSSRSSSSTTSRAPIANKNPANPLDGQIDVEARQRFGDQFGEIARQRAISDQMDVNRKAWFDEYRNRVAGYNAQNQAAYDQAQQINNALAGMNVAGGDSGGVGAAAANQRQVLQGSFGSLLGTRKANEAVLGTNRLNVADLKDLEAQKAEGGRKQELLSALNNLYQKERDWKTTRKSDLEAAAAKAQLEAMVLGNDVAKTSNDLKVEQAKLKQKAADAAAGRANKAADRAAKQAEADANRALKKQQQDETARHNRASEANAAAKASKKDGLSSKEVREFRRAWYNTLSLVQRDIKANGRRAPKDISARITSNKDFKGVDPFMAEAAAAYALWGGVLNPTAKRLKDLFGLKIRVRKPSDRTVSSSATTNTANTSGIGGILGGQ
jgi:hypothetical protein